MNSKERVIRAINHKPTDRVPYDHMGGSEEINKKFRLGHRGKIYVVTGATTDITYKNYNFFGVETEVTRMEID